MSSASRRRIGSIASHVAAAETELAVEQVDPATLNIHADGDAPLTDGEIEAFLSDGYVVLPGILGDGEDSLNGQLKRDLDEMVEARRAHQADSAVPVPHVVEFGTLGELVVHPPIVDKVKQLMGAYGNKRTDCSLHHIHAARHDEGEGPSYWHQDYEQNPQIDRENLMVHVFYYMNGLDGTVGDLMTLPKSQYSVMERGGFQGLWKEARLPGSVFFGEGNPLAPGSAIIVHSALMHGRAQKPGGEGKPRYFIDTSYCQPYDGDRKWPGGDNGHTIGQRLGLQAGKYDHVWDPTKCYAKKN